MEWVGAFASSGPLRVLDIGGRNINGTPRDLFPGATWLALDLVAGPGVDIVADAATWRTEERFDVVVCTEVFEHTPAWPEIIETAFAALRPGGLFVATCAAPGRGGHSADGTLNLTPDEHYENVTADDIAEEMASAGFDDFVTYQTFDFPCDTRVAAIKPGG